MLDGIQAGNIEVVPTEFAVVPIQILIVSNHRALRRYVLHTAQRSGVVRAGKVVRQVPPIVVPGKSAMG